MLVDSFIVPQCLYRPGTFTGLMTLYESNYVKLQQLCSTLSFDGSARVSTSLCDRDLHVEVVRREPYTTTLRFTYWFAEPGGPVADPDLLLRVYHDARLVEAVGCGEAHLHPKLRELARSSSAELDRRWRLNMMLNKWLDYLFEVGHSLEEQAGRSTGRP
jgi:uncharacterized protein YqiB (DUF1249 family)